MISLEIDKLSEILRKKREDYDVETEYMGIIFQIKLNMMRFLQNLNYNF